MSCIGINAFIDIFYEVNHLVLNMCRVIGNLSIVILSDIKQHFALENVVQIIMIDTSRNSETNNAILFPNTTNLA